MKLDYIYDQYFKGIINNISIQIKQTEIKDASLNLDGYKHSMVQVISLAIALKSSIIISNPPLVSDTYVFIANFPGIVILNLISYITKLGFSL